MLRNIALMRNSSLSYSKLSVTSGNRMINNLGICMMRKKEITINKFEYSSVNFKLDNLQFLV
jgi:hypothetical protein